MTTFSTGFPDTENPLATNWTTATGIDGGMRASGGVAYGSHAQESGSYYDGTAPANDQYAEAKFPSSSGSGWTAGCGVRYGSGNCYLFELDGTNVQMKEVSGGAFSDLGSPAALSFTATDVVRISAVGTTIKVQKNGADVVSATDSTLTSGTGCIYGWNNYSTGNHLDIDDFVLSDDFGGGGTVYTVDAVDYMFTADGTVKERELRIYDPMMTPDGRFDTQEKLIGEQFFLNDGGVKHLEKLMRDQELLGDTFDKILEKVITDSELLADARYSGLDKQLMEAVLLADVIIKTQEMLNYDPMFLYDIGTTEVSTSGALELLLTDYLYIASDVFRTHEATHTESLLLQDADFREQLKEFLDSVLFSETRTSALELSIVSNVLLDSTAQRLREMLLGEGFYISDSSSQQLAVAMATALVYARLRAKDLLGISTGDNADLLGIRLGHVQLNSDGGLLQ